MVLQIANWVGDFLILGIAGIIWLVLIGGVFLLLVQVIERIKEW